MSSESSGSHDARGHLLVLRCREGDERAWAEVYDNHAPAVRRFLACMLPGSEDIEDLVQSVFLSFLRSLPRFERRCALSSWMLGIAAHTARGALRTQARRRRKEAAMAMAMRVLNFGGAASAQGQVEARQDLERLEQALDALDAKHREVWVMREVMGLSPQHTAEALGEPAATVRSRHFRARGTLLRAMEEPEGQVIAHAQAQMPAAATSTATSTATRSNAASPARRQP